MERQVSIELSSELSFGGPQSIELPAEISHDGRAIFELADLLQSQALQGVANREDLFDLTLR